MLTLLHGGPASRLWTGGAIIKASERETLEDAVALLQRAEAVLADTEARVAEARAEGHAAGLAAAGAALTRAHAEALGAMAREVAAREAARDAAIAEAALAAVRALLGDAGIDRAAITAGLVARAVAGLPGHGGPVTVRVAADAVDATRAALEATAAAGSEAAATHPIRVEADPALAPLDALIEAGRGQLVASLSVQLDELAQRWGLSDGAAPSAHAARAEGAA